MLKRRYSFFSGPSGPNTTQEATVPSPPVWLMSKHSIREGGARKVAGGAEIAAAAHQHDADGVLARLADDRERVDIGLPLGGHDLLRLDALERRALIADLRRALELERLARLLHTLLELGVHFVAATLEHLDRRRNVLRVGVARDEADARGRAAPDLMLQAGATPVGEEAVAAV